jgi:hypothetical protein
MRLPGKFELTHSGGLFMPKRTIVIKNFVRDFESGKTNEELMQNYELDLWGLRNTLKKMMEIKALALEDVRDRIPSFHGVSDGDDRRSLQRRFVLFSFPVYEADDLAEEGLVNDISEKGLQVSGIRSGVGEAKSLLIRADEFADIYPFVFEATCRWINPVDERGECAAGFEITNISEGGLEELRKLIKMLAFE